MSIAWKRIEPTETLKVHWRTLVEKTFELPDGTIKSYTTMNNEGMECAAVLGLTPDNQVILVSIYRPGPEKIMHEIPGGYIDAGEDPETAARRELLEESGYVPGALTYLGKIHKDGGTNAVHHYFLATDCVLGDLPADKDVDEFIEVSLVPIDQLLQNARNALMTDTEAVFLAYEELARRNTGQ
jgi:ADP-ribose pyrophosphatase